VSYILRLNKITFNMFKLILSDGEWSPLREQYD